jgi:hypothetical protein
MRALPVSLVVLSVFFVGSALLQAEPQKAHDPIVGRYD